jgi:(p)ppGpp synthase/HD superfamily hydrolase
MCEPNAPLIAKASALARKTHADQTDKDSRLSTPAPRRACAPEGRDAMIAAVLHDTIEDGQITPAQIRAKKASPTKPSVPSRNRC